MRKTEQEAYSPELNPVENLWKHIGETGGFKNKTFQNMDKIEEHLAK